MKNWIPANGFTFGLIGSVGFVVDGGILTLLTLWLSLNLYLARAISFAWATGVTWYLNRCFTFNMHKVKKASKVEYVKYLAVQVGGGMLNLSVFMVLLYFFDWMNELPILPLAIGALFGMIFNYFFSRVWVFGTGALK